MIKPRILLDEVDKDLERRGDTFCRNIYVRSKRRVFTPVGALHLCLAGLLRPAQRGGAGQQPLGGRVRVRASADPRPGQDAAAGHYGADDHASRLPRGRIRAGQPGHLRSLIQLGA